MVGYSRERRGYRIYDLEKGIIEERSIRCNELEFDNKYLENDDYEETYNYECNNILLDIEEEINNIDRIQMLTDANNETVENEPIGDDPQQDVNRPQSRL